MSKKTNPQDPSEDLAAFKPRLTVCSGAEEICELGRDFGESRLARGLLMDGSRSVPLRVNALYPGGGDIVDAAEQHAAMYTNTGLNRRTFTGIGGGRKIDFICNEGTEHVREVARESRGTVITFHYDARGGASTRLPLAMKELQAIAKEFGVHILMFVSNGSAAREDLQEYSDEFIELAKCEPGPGAMAAFALFNQERSLMFFAGVHREMWQIKKNDEGKWVRVRSPFIHAKVAMRFKHILRSEGKTLQCIADLFEVNVSTIHRDMSSMPPVEKSVKPMSSSLMAKYIEHLNLKVPGTATAKPNEDDQVLDDDSKLPGQDDVDAAPEDTPHLPPKKRPAAKKRGFKR